ncbi:hypothetical protein LRH25_17390 [Ideonella azotifigens]|uniref:Type 4a pilus biogenesis protein PilY1 n=1 Tax=Ideonella azotifigens TaxID=513160 RepID=A0ABN1K6J1_9BURK|nr:PilC/PilY family type IV pilus protein [Ideonella azotifigens]MCD2342115.1 hypothetical protein [Ideonella azotifigens]
MKVFAMNMVRHMPAEVAPWAFASVAFLCLTSLALDAAAIEPSQTPLTSRVGDTPPPNVMITLDDSGSMNSDFMPAGAVTVNNVSVRLDSSTASDRLAAFLNDQRKANANQLSAYIPAVKGTGAKLYQMQFRSPDLNTIWYNPEVRYRPWLKSTPLADGTGQYMNNAVPTAAYWDPMQPGLGSFNLTTNWTGVQTTWCQAYNSCGSATLDYYPGLFYRLKSGAAPDKTANFVQYDVNDAANYSPSKTSKAAARTDCAGATTCTQAEERINFANWFTYHRMREALAKGALTESLFGFQNKMRAGWGRINSGTTNNVDGSLGFKVIRTGIRNLDKAQLQTILAGVQGIASNGGTPLRTALDSVGPYFNNRTDAYSPWLTTIGTAGSGKLSCRRSINLLTTDGYYNDSYSAAGDLTNVDGSYSYTSAADNPGGFSPTHYVAQRPYIDGRTKDDSANIAFNSLTDAAMRWYIQDLDGTVVNKVTPTDTDIAFWQHLTQFTIGIGVKGTLDSSSPDAKAATLLALSDPNGSAMWPKPSTDPQKIDDLWHAAVNTGGDFYSVKNGAELSAAITNVFSKATGVDSREAGVATVTSTLSASNLKFVPQYKSGAWYGDVYAYELDTNGDVVSTKAKWQASTKLPAAAARKLYTLSGGAGVEFKSTTLVASDLSAIGSADLVNYIRGESTNEGNSLSFRPRGGQLLGDFVNSPPVYVRDLLDSSYGNLADTTQAGSYASFLAAKKARNEGALVVGGNAGVFHVFRGSDGVETFGYLPRAGFSNLNLVAAKNYGTTDNFHRFFVDGPAVEADAYLTPKGETGPRWVNMLLGSMGAGGKSVFALHVPTDDPTAQLGANSIQWELNSHADLGYVMNDMRTGKIQGGGGWYAFIGNGPYSTNGKAALLVVNLQTGAVVRSIDVNTTGANGLGGVRLVRNANMEVYAAYAGDLQGNLWRFDFGNSDPSSWGVAFNGSPLFKATDSTGAAQPIVAAPAIVPHTIKGYVVTFGTGRLIDTADSAVIAPQTYYGVWDDTVINASAATVASPFFAASQSGGVAPYRSVLVQQSIGTSTIAGSGSNAGMTYYTVSSNTVDWNQKKGWYIELNVKAGQRTVYPAQTILNYVYFSTIVPAVKAAECEFTSGSGYNFLVDAVTGAASTTPVFDTNGDGVVSGSDSVVAGFGTLADGSDKMLTNNTGVVNEDSAARCLPDVNAKCQNPDENCLVVIVDSTNTGKEACVKGPPCVAGDERCCPDGTPRNGRIGNCAPDVGGIITDRVWRQIVNPPQP